MGRKRAQKAILVRPKLGVRAAFSVKQEEKRTIKTFSFYIFKMKPFIAKDPKSSNKREEKGRRRKVCKALHFLLNRGFGMTQIHSSGSPFLRVEMLLF